MAKTPQVSNAGTRARLGTTPLGWRYDARDDVEVACADVRTDLVRIAGAKYEISGSGRIRLA